MTVTWPAPDPRWVVSMTRSPQGNAAFSTGGLAAFGLPDIVLHAPASALDDPEEQRVPVEMLTTIAEAVITLGRIPVPDDHFEVAANGSGFKWPFLFEARDYVLHDVTAALTGIAQTTGLVEVYPDL